MLQIFKEAQVSSGRFQNLFRSKDGVLMELVRFMFENQFGMASSVAGAALSPACRRYEFSPDGLLPSEK